MERIVAYVVTFAIMERSFAYAQKKTGRTGFA